MRIRTYVLLDLLGVLWSAVSSMHSWRAWQESVMKRPYVQSKPTRSSILYDLLYCMHIHIYTTNTWHTYVYVTCILNSLFCFRVVCLNQGIPCSTLLPENSGTYVHMYLCCIVLSLKLLRSKMFCTYSGAYRSICMSHPKAAHMLLASLSQANCIFGGLTVMHSFVKHMKHAVLLMCSQPHHLTSLFCLEPKTCSNHCVRSMGWYMYSFY